MSNKRQATFHPSGGLHMLHIGQLTHEALGKEVTLASPHSGTYITGPLLGVEHEAALIETTALGDLLPRAEVGQVTTVLTVGNWRSQPLPTTTLIGIVL